MITLTAVMICRMNFNTIAFAWKLRQRDTTLENKVKDGSFWAILHLQLTLFTRLVLLEARL